MYKGAAQEMLPVVFRAARPLQQHPELREDLVNQPLLAPGRSPTDTDSLLVCIGDVQSLGLSIHWPNRYFLCARPCTGHCSMRSVRFFPLKNTPSHRQIQHSETHSEGAKPSTHSTNPANFSPDRSHAPQPGLRLTPASESRTPAQEGPLCRDVQALPQPSGPCPSSMN